MRILLAVEFYYAPGGGGIQEQVRRIAEGLVTKGNEVTVATSYVNGRSSIINGVKIVGFNVHGDNVWGIHGDKDKYVKFLLDQDNDVVVCFGGNVWTTDLLFSVGDKIRAKKVLSTPGLSKLGNEKYDKYYEKDYLPAIRGFDALVYTSENYRDKVFGDNNGLGDKAIIIPNGASEEEFIGPARFKIREKLKITSPYIAITVANHYRAKGHRFVISAFKKLRRKDITLLIIGERFVSTGVKKWGHFVLDYMYCFGSSLFSRRIVLLNGKERDMVLAAYKGADLFLFGSELECAPLVMYESFAAKLPFITTDVGNVKDHSRYIKIVRSPIEMAEVSNRLLNNRNERETMSEVSYAEWKKNHTWTRIADMYNDLFNRLIVEKDE